MMRGSMVAPMEGSAATLTKPRSPVDRSRAFITTASSSLTRRCTTGVSSLPIWVNLTDLVLRPPDGFPFIAELVPGGSAVELPVDSGVAAVDVPIPGTDFPAQFFQVGDSPGARTLPRQEADLDFGLIQPASVFWRVVNGESIPDFAADLLAEQVRQRLAPMDVQVVHDEMDRVGVRILDCQIDQYLNEARG